VNQVLGVYIKKSITFQGAPRTFGNTYHFSADNVQIWDEGDCSVLAGAVAQAERQVHSTSVAFLEAAVWGPTDNGNQQDNIMRYRGSLSGNGSAGPGTKPIYRELALMFKWPLGRYGSKNRPQYLRKWIHPCADIGTWTDLQLQGVDQIVMMTSMTNYVTAVTNVTVTGAPDTTVALCTFDGRLPVAAGSVKPYIEHHQFGR
jgi:hypothetical protein